MAELAGRSFPLTQEAFALMMGVRRTTLTTIASRMQAEGLISYHRGRMELVDMKAIRTMACECHSELESHHALAFGQLQSEMGGSHSPGVTNRADGNGGSQLDH
jgi:Mn-dependent DtxR family transcriptional regulator